MDKILNTADDNRDKTNHCSECKAYNVYAFYQKWFSPLPSFGVIIA